MLSMLGNIFTDCNNWVRSWDNAVFAIVIVLFVALLGMFTVNLFKGMLGSKFRFKFFSFLFILILVALIVYICIIR